MNEPFSNGMESNYLKFKSKFIFLNLCVLLLYYQAVSVSECLLVIVLTGFFKTQVRTSWKMEKNTASTISVYRNDLPENPIEADGKKTAPFMTILDGSYSYLTKLNGQMPDKVQFSALGFTK